jgi:hypothetical protein
MKAAFDICVGIAVIAGTIFTGLTWWGLPPPQGGIKAMFPGNWLSWSPQTLAVLGLLVLFSTWLLIAVRMGWLGRSDQKFAFRDGPPDTVISKKIFTNERVVLDGKAFRDCTFENVTYVFNGTRPFALSKNHFNGRIQVASDNPSIQGTFIWLRGLGLLRSEIDFRNESGSIVEPPTP